MSEYGNSQAWGPAYQGLPVVHSRFVDTDGQITGPWYRFMLTTWQKIGSGIPNDVTLGSMMLQTNHNTAQIGLAQTAANTAGTSAATANSAVAAETDRSITAENVLQGQITSLANQVDGLVVNGVVGVPTGAPVAGLSITHGGVNYVIPLYA